MWLGLVHVANPYPHDNLRYYNISKIPPIIRLLPVDRFFVSEYRMPNPKLIFLRPKLDFLQSSTLFLLLVTLKSLHFVEPPYHSVVTFYRLGTTLNGRIVFLCA